MTQTEPTMKTVNRDEAQQQFDQLINQVAQGKTRTLIEEDGQTVAALISAEDLKRFQLYEDFRVLEEFGKAFEDQTPEQIEREVAKALREVRADKRKQSQQPTTP